ncbi:MAG: hypothetical protein ACYDD0_04960 [Candidatus Dormibacteria bacterium]
MGLATSKSVPAELAERDLRLLRAIRSLPDRQLDRAHWPPGGRCAELGWRGSDASGDGCLVGAMSRLEFLRSHGASPACCCSPPDSTAGPLRKHDAQEDLTALRARQLSAAARRRLGELLGIEHYRRHRGEEAARVEPETAESWPR